MNGLHEPTCSVDINTIEEAKGGNGCDVTYTITCIAGTNADKVETEALSQTTADACTASIEVQQLSHASYQHTLTHNSPSPVVPSPLTYPLSPNHITSPYPNNSFSSFLGQWLSRWCVW